MSFTQVIPPRDVTKTETKNIIALNVVTKIHIHLLFNSANDRQKQPKFTHINYSILQMTNRNIHLMQIPEKLHEFLYRTAESASSSIHPKCCT